MDKKIELYGNVNDLIDIFESYINYIEVCGYDTHPEIDKCNYFLNQLK